MGDGNWVVPSFLMGGTGAACFLVAATYDGWPPVVMAFGWIIVACICVWLCSTHWIGLLIAGLLIKLEIDQWVDARHQMRSPDEILAWTIAGSLALFIAGGIAALGLREDRDRREWRDGWYF